MANEKLVLILGVSGVGKSTIISKVVEKDSHFRRVISFTDRQLRVNETEKEYISKQDFDIMEMNKAFISVTSIFGNRYGIRKDSIDNSLNQGFSPIIDYPLYNMDMLERYKDRWVRLYIAPPSIEVIKQRLLSLGRDNDKERMFQAIEELKDLQQKKFIHPSIDKAFINHRIDVTTENILHFLRDL